MTIFLSPESYRTFIQSLPRPCVDIVPINEAHQVLLLLRKSEPEAGKWWLPGGRVLHSEPRIDCARRKLLEETRLNAIELVDLNTCSDLFFEYDEIKQHDITHIYAARTDFSPILIDNNYFSEHGWFDYGSSLRLGLHAHVQKAIELALDHCSTRKEP